MSATLTITILGCGSSGGVPRLGGHWGACDPTNPRNRRRRCSILVERHEGDAVTRVLIDSSPDMREQLLDAQIGHLDGVVYTHEHADHTHGLDDLRMIVFNRKLRLPVWSDAATRDNLFARFGYAFVQPENSSYPPILEHNLITGSFEVPGPAGPIPFTPFEVGHGRISALGFRIHDFAYLPDVSEMTDAAWAAVQGLECWVLDALRYTPHPTHTHVEQSLEWIARATPKQAVLTNMHIDVDYATIATEVPVNVQPAYDGLSLRFTLP